MTILFLSKKPDNKSNGIVAIRNDSRQHLTDPRFFEPLRRAFSYHAGTAVRIPGASGSGKEWKKLWNTILCEWKEQVESGEYMLLLVPIKKPGDKKKKKPELRDLK